MESDMETQMEIDTLPDPETSEASNDKVSNAHGWIYETRLLMLLFIRAFMLGWTDFKLRYQVKKAGKLDDVVFYDGSKYYCIQLKHILDEKTKETEETKKITHSKLFHKDYSEKFNLIKYVINMIKISTNEDWKGKDITAVVFTNYDFELIKEDKTVTNKVPLKMDSFGKKWYPDVQRSVKRKKGYKDEGLSIKLTPAEPTEIPNFYDKVPDGSGFYKFTDDETIVQILLNQVNDRNYIDKKDKEEIDKIIKSEMQNNDKNGKEEYDKIYKQKIRDALSKIIYAVRQPSSEQLKKNVIKQVIQEYDKSGDADTIYSRLETLFRGWCDTKVFDQSSQSTQSNVEEQHVIRYDDVRVFFQKNVRLVKFRVPAPTDKFKGRSNDLKSILTKFNENKSIVTISGFEGIGKTELAKKYCDEYGESVFFGRLIWIEAANDETVKDSFVQLAKVLKIEDVDNKNIELIIQEVFQYFKRFKILFVFDNFDTSLEYEGKLVNYCLEIGNCSSVQQSSTVSPTGISSSSSRPYFLFTSRNPNCIQGSPIKLEKLSLEEAQAFIQCRVDVTDENAKKLAETLKRFPLALKHAIAYIKPEHERHKILNGPQTACENYLQKFDKMRQDLKNIGFSDDSEGYAIIAHVTCSINLDAIKSDQVNGNGAIKVFQILAFLHPDQIYGEMFLPLFEDDDIKTDESLRLLETYSLITIVEQERTFCQIHRSVQVVQQNLLYLSVENKNEIQEKTFNLIDPELYKAFEAIQKKNYAYGPLGTAMEPVHNMKKHMTKFSVNQILHYNNLSVHMLVEKNLRRKYERFFTDLNDSVLFKAAFEDDVQKLKKIVSIKKLTSYVKSHIEILLCYNSNKTIKHLINEGRLGVDEILKGKSLIYWSVKLYNVEILKFLIDKKADLSDLLEYTSKTYGESIKEFINDIRSKRSDSFRDIISRIDNNSDEDELKIRILNELLFFAIIINEESLVEKLIDKINWTDDSVSYRQLKLKPSYFKNEIPFICVAALLGYTNILKMLLNATKHNLGSILSDLSTHKFFNSKENYQIIFKKFLEQGELIYDDGLKGWSLRQIDRNTLLNDAVDSMKYNISKLNIVEYLLEEGADPLFPKCINKTVIKMLIEYISDDDLTILSIKNKDQIIKLMNEMIFNNLTPDKFMNIVINGFFTIENWSTNASCWNLFERLCNQIGGIKVKNEKGETLLIKYLQNVVSSDKNYCDYSSDKFLNFDIRTKDPNFFKHVKFLVEKCKIDINVKDEKGKDVLFYAGRTQYTNIIPFLLDTARIPYNMQGVILSL